APCSSIWGCRSGASHGKDCRYAPPRPQVEGSPPQPVQALRARRRLPEKVRALPYLFPAALPAGRRPRRHQVELVGERMTTDPIADFLTRIRNGILARHAEVVAPASRLKERLCEVLETEGYIAGHALREQGGIGELVVRLRWADPRTN